MGVGSRMLLGGTVHREFSDIKGYDYQTWII